MFKFISLFALLAVASAAPGLIAQTHSVVQPAVYAASPVVHTYAASAPVVKTFASSLVQTYAAAPVFKTYAAPAVHSTYAAAPVVKHISAPALHTTYAAGPLIHQAPLVKTLVSSPVVYSNGLYH